jgi:branched-chain amino acid transport system ATP-binding protein
MALLTVSHLEKSFGGVSAISDLSFEVPEGIVHAVIGPNGAGKTTLFNMLCGFYTPDDGSIRFRDRELVRLKPHRIAACGISRTFQNLQIFLNMSILDNVMVGCHLRSKVGMVRAALRLPSVWREERQVNDWAREALAFCGLEDMAGRAASSLPYGGLKRLEIARALAAKPSFLLMDEPAAGLNDTETVEMRELIRRISESGVTVLLVEHNMGLVMQVSDRVAVLDYGSLLAEGTPGEVQADHRVVEAYLGGGAMQHEVA